MWIHFLLCFVSVSELCFVCLHDEEQAMYTHFLLCFVCLSVNFVLYVCMML